MNEQFDSYCERTDFTFWAEPVNALTNAAFLIAAIWAWRRIGERRAHPLSQALCVILFLIGIGSFLFHTFATGWAALADTAPILLYVLVYIFAATRLIFRQSLWRSLLLTAAGIAFAAVAGRALGWMLPLGSSAAYAGIPVLIALYAARLWPRDARTASGWLLGVAILCASLALRSADIPLCASFPLGTHFLWHLPNAVMLAHMIGILERGRPLASAVRER